jgi:hypothetical protein
LEAAPVANITGLHTDQPPADKHAWRAWVGGAARRPSNTDIGVPEGFFSVFTMSRGTQLAVAKRFEHSYPNLLLQSFRMGNR